MEIEPVVSDSVFMFSGLFSFKAEQKHLIAKRSRYKIFKENVDIQQIIKSQYYPVFRKFILNNPREDYLELVDSCSYTLKLKVDDGRWEEFQLVDVRLTFFDDDIGLGLYSYEVKFPNLLSLSQLIPLLRRLREFDAVISFNEKESNLLTFIEQNILRLEDNLATKNVLSISKDSEVYDYRGTKLKSFLCVDLQDLPSDCSLDQTLYELGTLTDFGTSMQKDTSFSPSKKYFDEILSKKISVFNNWSALPLFDSFVMIGTNGYLESSSTRNTIRGSYFKIFLFNLYSKFYLFKTNSDMEMDKKKRNIGDLYAFLGKYDLSHISYNFLPNMLHTSIREGLEIPSELKSVRAKIELIDSRKRNNEVSFINALLLFIGGLSIISVLSDFPGVIKAAFDFCDAKVATYIGVGIVLVIFLSVLFHHKNYRKR